VGRGGAIQSRTGLIDIAVTDFLLRIELCRLKQPSYVGTPWWATDKTPLGGHDGQH